MRASVNWGQWVRAWDREGGAVRVWDRESVSTTRHTAWDRETVSASVAYNTEFLASVSSRVVRAVSERWDTLSELASAGTLIELGPAGAGILSLRGDTQ